MKLKVMVPFERVDHGSTPDLLHFSVKSKLMEVDAVGIRREAWGAGTGRWRYYAEFYPPECVPECERAGLSYSGGLMRVWILRRNNPTWVPPAFPDKAWRVDVPHEVAA